MAYRKINVELIVFEEETNAVVAELNLALDRLEETHTIFGGDFDISPVEESGTKRKSALRHTLDAGNTAASSVKFAAQKIKGTYKKVI